MIVTVIAPPLPLLVPGIHHSKSLRLPLSSLVVDVEVNTVAVLEVANGIAGSSSTGLWALQDPLTTAVATPPISIHCSIIDSTTLPPVLPDLRDICTVALISSVINDHELLAALVRLIIRVVERGVFGDCGLRRELGTPVTAVRVVRIHLIDGDEVYQHIYKQERWDKSALTRCAPQSTPLRLPLRHNRPLSAPSRLLPH